MEGAVDGKSVGLAEGFADIEGDSEGGSEGAVEILGTRLGCSVVKEGAELMEGAAETEGWQRAEQSNK